jgi:hypothetical protein
MLQHRPLHSLQMKDAIGIRLLKMHVWRTVEPHVLVRLVSRDHDEQEQRMKSRSRDSAERPYRDNGSRAGIKEQKGQIESYTV